MNNYTVYMHVFPDGKKYVGITGQNVEKRWGKGRYYKSCTLVYEAIQKYGWDNIEHIILFEDLQKEEAEQKEIELIEFYNLSDERYGYNLCKGGRTNFPNEKVLEKLRKKEPWNKGKTKIYTQEQIYNLSTKVMELWEDKIYREKHCKKVRCIELNMIFDSLTEASNYFGMNNTSHISACCRDKSKSCGKYKGKKLHWEYVMNE